MRCSWQFRYFTTNGADPNIKLATSRYVRFRQGKTEPLHVRIAKTEKDTEMRVMWACAPVEKPVVEYGTSPFFLNRRATGSGDSYKATDMCQAPAAYVTAGWFRDPVIIYNAVLADLKPETSYYYRISGGGSSVCIKTFKLKTPPTPGSQKGVTSP